MRLSSCIALLAVAATATTASAQLVVECTINIWAEDIQPADGNAFDLQYTECLDRNDGKRYLLLDSPKLLSQFYPGDTAQLRLESLSASDRNAYFPDGAKQPSAVAFQGAYRPVDVMNLEKKAANPRSWGETDERSVLVVRMKYSDTITECDDGCADELWTPHQLASDGVVGSMQGLFEVSSYGATIWPTSKRNIVLVDMGKNLPVDSCDYTAEGVEATSILKDMMGLDPAEYRHIEILLPAEFGKGSCTSDWAGVAMVGCQHPSMEAAGGQCFSYVRSATVAVRVKEFAHNLGAGHSGSQSDSENGDLSSVSGLSWDSWRTFNAPQRFQAGWLLLDRVLELNVPKPPTLFALQPLNSKSSLLPSAIRWLCDECEAASFTGGYVWISYRNDDGYDKDLRSEHKNKVVVHIAQRYFPGKWGGATQVYALLGPGDSFDIGDGSTVYVGSVSAGEAKVVVSRSWEVVAGFRFDAVHTGEYAFPPLPPPPPSHSDFRAARLCSNTCKYSNDGDCDDGGAGAEYSAACFLGTDCADCGDRPAQTVALPPAAASPPPPSPYPPGRLVPEYASSPPSPPPTGFIRGCVQPESGANTGLRIVGGYPIDYERQYQFLVSVVAGGLFCGGVLISNQWVLTAAHCTQFRTKEQIVVWVGAHRLFLLGASGCVLRRGVAQMIQHPSYNSGTKRNDITLLKLDSPVDYSPIELYDPSVDKWKPQGTLEEAGTNLRVLGWGYTSEGSGVIADTPSWAPVPVVNNDDCQRTFSSVSDSMICAGGQEGVDACQGDSGGPLISVVGGRRQLIGLVSYGRGCARAGIPGVYTRTSAYRGWICQHTGIKSACQRPTTRPRDPPSPPPPPPLPPCSTIMGRPNLRGRNPPEWCNKHNRITSKWECERYRIALSNRNGVEKGNLCLYDSASRACLISERSYTCSSPSSPPPPSPRPPPRQLNPIDPPNDDCRELESLTDVQLTGEWCNENPGRQNIRAVCNRHYATTYTGGSLWVAVRCNWERKGHCKLSGREYRCNRRRAASLPPPSSQRTTSPPSPAPMPPTNSRGGHTWSGPSCEQIGQWTDLRQGNSPEWCSSQTVRRSKSQCEGNFLGLSRSDGWVEGQWCVYKEATQECRASVEYFKCSTSVVSGALRGAPLEPSPPLEPGDIPQEGIEVIFGGSEEHAVIRCLWPEDNDKTELVTSPGGRNEIAAQCCTTEGQCVRVVDEQCIAGQSVETTPHLARTFTYKQNFEYCAERGYTMCDKSCAGTGCGYNRHPVYTSRHCSNQPHVDSELEAYQYGDYTPSPPFLPPSPPTSPPLPRSPPTPPYRPIPFQVGGGTTSPSPPPPPPPSSSSSGDGASPALVGSILGAAAGICLLGSVIAAYLVYRERKHGGSLANRWSVRKRGGGGGAPGPGAATAAAAPMRSSWSLRLSMRNSWSQRRSERTAPIKDVEIERGISGKWKSTVVQNVDFVRATEPVDSDRSDKSTNGEDVDCSTATERSKERKQPQTPVHATRSRPPAGSVVMKYDMSAVTPTASSPSSFSESASGKSPRTATAADAQSPRHPTRSVRSGLDAAVVSKSPRQVSQGSSKSPPSTGSKQHMAMENGGASALVDRQASPAMARQPKATKPDAAAAVSPLPAATPHSPRVQDVGADSVQASRPPPPPPPARPPPRPPSRPKSRGSGSAGADKERTDSKTPDRRVRTPDLRVSTPARIAPAPQESSIEEVCARGLARQQRRYYA